MGSRFDRTLLLGPELSESVRARRALGLDLLEAALDAVEPGRCTRAALERLELSGPQTLFAFGKASVAMARAAMAHVRVVEGIVVSLEEAQLKGVRTLLGGHPDPAPDAERTGAAVFELARGLTEGDSALCLVSGGGSAMLELPRPGVSTEQMRALIRQLREGGADIGELNAVRRACSQLKGGGLARACEPADVISVVLSDVPGHELSTVASGPSCMPPRHAPRAADVLKRYGLRFELPDPPDPWTGAPPRVVLAADLGTARSAVVAAGIARGLPIEERMGTFEGDAVTLGRRLATETAEPDGRRAWIWGGETTVVVRGSGRGGRNQELALGALAEGWPGGLLLCAGTDGVDGQSPAAGALLDEAVVERATALGLQPETYLADNDSFSFFDQIGASLRTGPTGTNVADLCLYLP